MTSVATLPVLAAGAVCWRMVDGKARVLLVHRTQHKDVSLPKGKLDPGETLPETAVREIAEETGLAIALGAPLGQVEYELPGGREKKVYYWAAEVTDETVATSRFTPNDEIAALEWVSLSRARRAVSYDHDRQILDTFEQRLNAGTARTFAIIALRHAKTVPGEAWDGPDATRPLMQRGADQAASIAHGLAAYRPQKIFTSTAARCIATIGPIARLSGVKVKQTEGLSQDAHELGEARVHEIVTKRLARRQSVVLCTHGPVLPDLLDEIAHLTQTPITSAVRHAAMLSPGEYSVVHISSENPSAGIVAIETHSPSAG
ncbi:8-oxo-dGTP diphosphatase [Glaciihabitans tibetensis]|uniref:8-oxo-dGTP diphosphatase n=1 Tax=Glaciihabitans tibetensis TaxID=1266600 RepID=A0A2T0VC14_9MICO|nr:NUDIX hydrolase [Glaciihabitans tibetensis]PRY67710.1 8-oxo-dGTP diphosphatase [Glaciihabitans tibetensis]